MLGTTIFQQENLNQKTGKIQHPLQHEHGDRQHGMQSDRVGEHGILRAILRYMDDLPEKTLPEAQERNTARVKLTPREQESCTVREATDPLAEGNHLLEKRVRQARPPTTPRTAAGRHRVVS